MSTNGRPPSTALGTHHPPLDGIRAISVAAVLAYHARLDGVPGGFLGISQFFTLSGFLITSMLLRSREAPGGLRLRSFLARRYRRLLPAAYLTLAGVVVFGATVATEQQLDDLPEAVAACVAQVANWFFALTGRSYVDLFAAPSPVQHFWSLAVEEQFYVALPLVVLLVSRLTRSLRPLALLLAGGVVASTAAMVVLYERGIDLDRLYYGTDTRAAELLVGAVLAIVLHRRTLRLGAAGRRVLGGVGVAALAITTWTWASVSLTDEALWRGGFLAYSLVTTALILAAVAGAGPVPRLLSVQPLPAIGRISYGVYLFHWPIFLWLTEERTGLDVWPLFALRVLITLAVASASYHFLEMPVRNRSGWAMTPRIGWAAASVAVVVVLGAVAVGQRTVETDLAGLGEPIRGAPVAEGRAATLQVLVVPAPGTAVVTDLEELAGGSANLAVASSRPFSCPRVATRGGIRTCANWLEEWPRLVEDLEPDVVLLHVDDWPPAELAVLSGSSDPRAQEEWTAEVLGHGLDLLTARGASVVWSGDGTSDLGTALQRRAEPFFRAMQRLLSLRSDLHVLAPRDWDAGQLLTELRTYRRTEPGSVPRVLVVGDSSSRTLGAGLERWAADARTSVVWSAGAEGCGIAHAGRSREVRGRTDEAPEECRDVQATWRAQIREFDPDVVVVLSTIFDLQRRRLDGWSSFLGPGDAAFDDYLVDEYVEAYDTLSNGGAQVVWVLSPCARDLLGQVVAPEDGGPLDPGRIRHLNDVVLRRVAEERPAMRTFDLYDILCPDGDFVEGMDGVEVLRTDGYHFSPEGARWVAERYGPELVAGG